MKEKKIKRMFTSYNFLFKFFTNNLICLQLFLIALVARHITCKIECCFSVSQAIRDIIEQTIIFNAICDVSGCRFLDQ